MCCGRNGRGCAGDSIGGTCHPWKNTEAGKGVPRRCGCALFCPHRQLAGSGVPLVRSGLCENVPCIPVSRKGPRPYICQNNRSPFHYIGAGCPQGAVPGRLVPFRLKTDGSWGLTEGNAARLSVGWSGAGDRAGCEAGTCRCGGHFPGIRAMCRPLSWEGWQGRFPEIPGSCICPPDPVWSAT